MHVVWKFNQSFIHLKRPGHGYSLQPLVSVVTPTQSFPPFLGLGLLQILVRNCLPPPQFAEQADQSL